MEVAIQPVSLAKKLIAETGELLNAFSSRCGYTDVNYFVRLFRKKEGLTPGGVQAFGAAALAGRQRTTPNGKSQIIPETPPPRSARTRTIIFAGIDSEDQKF